jgi:hypothetical protein
MVEIQCEICLKFYDVDEIKNNCCKLCTKRKNKQQEAIKHHTFIPENKERTRAPTLFNKSELNEYKRMYRRAHADRINERRRYRYSTDEDYRRRRMGYKIDENGNMYNNLHMRVACEYCDKLYSLSYIKNHLKRIHKLND